MEVNKIYPGDCLEVLKTFPDESIDSCVTDPPYDLTAMTKPRIDQTENGSYGKQVPFSRVQAALVLLALN